MSLSTSELWVSTVPRNMVKPSCKNIYTDRPKVVLLLCVIFVIYVLCLSGFLNYEIVTSFILDNYVIIMRKLCSFYEKVFPVIMR